MSTIFDLIDAGDGAGLRSLLERDPDAAAGRDERGLSAVMRAAYRGGDVFAAVRDAEPPLDPFDRIVAGHSDGLPRPDAWSADGFTALHLAAFAHNAEAARALLDAGADADAIAAAAFARVTPLGTCAFSGAVEVARVLLEHGANPNLTAEHGVTPLDGAVSNGYDELVELLRAHGARAG